MRSRPAFPPRALLVVALLSACSPLEVPADPGADAGSQAPDRDPAASAGDARAQDDAAEADAGSGSDAAAPGEDSGAIEADSGAQAADAVFTAPDASEDDAAIAPGDDAGASADAGTLPDASAPPDAGGLPSATAIGVAAGRLHSCAVTSAGAVRCWGYHNYGQLGHGAAAAEVSVPLPVEVQGVSGATAIAAGSDHSCTIAGGALRCWGLNDRGQLGDGSTTNRVSPVLVQGLTAGVTAIACGESHSCALIGGAVRCWGHNDYGQLGNDSTDDASTPVDVVGLGSGVVAIAAGRYHSCAVTSAGAALCWGGNLYGELGDGGNGSSRVPIAVAGLGATAASISAGDSVTCVVTGGGAARCWGRNGHGQVGNGSGGTLQEVHAPAQVVGLTGGVTAIAVGWEFTCAIASGAARCFGTNFGGALGNNMPDSFESNTPVAVSGLGAGASAISTGVGHACAVHNGAARCWGDNSGGQLGDGSDVTARAPVPVVSLP